MVRGIVKFRAKIVSADKALTFPLFAFNPNNPDVDRVEIQAPTGDEIRSTVHLSTVVSSEAGIVTATEVHTAALNRISFFYDIAIENGQISESEFSLTDPPPGFRVSAGTGFFSTTGFPAKFERHLSAADLQAKLEQPSPAGEQHFGLFRSARQSTSPVEEFMHLYNILQMLLGDQQSAVDDFIRREDPAVTQTQSPHTGGMETIYTRLRNELGHKRAGVDLAETKAEMMNRLPELIVFTKRAIQSPP